MWTLPARGLVVLAAFLLVAIRSAEADSLLLPPVGAPGFKALCTDMYEKRDTPEGWPVQFQGSAHHCTLKTHAGTSTDMTEDDYAWSLRKSLTFACKGKREVIYEVVRRLRDCNGESRTIEMLPDPATPGACRVSFLETTEAFSVAPPLIADLTEWRADMPWYERLLVNLFAPRELPMVMDGLIACAGPEKG
jgi:hypothetical protein